MTASGVLLAAYAEVLSLWSRRQHFTINLTLFNRLSLHEDVERVVGDFTSLTLLEADYRGSGGYVGRGRRLQEQLWEDIDRRYVSGVEVMRELARKRGAAQAAMPVVFTSELNFTTSNDEASRQEVASEKTGDDGKLEHIYGISQTPQVWLDLQVSEVNGDLVFNWDGVEELFPDGLVQQMFDAFTLLIDRLATGDDAWDDACPLSLTPEQAERRTAFNSTDTPIPDSLLHRPFLEQATRAPEAPALISNRLGLSYGELERLTRRLALRLRREGTHPNSLVAVVMEKGWEQVAAVLAVLRAGAAYLPVSADLPSERLCHLLRHGEVAVALTQPWVEGRVEWPEGVTRISVVVDEEDEDGEGEAGVETDAARAEPDLDAVQRPSDLAYVIYTSGSTGQPKGVMIDHRGALNTVLDVNARFGLSPADRVLGLSSLSFDLSVYDIFGTLGAGAALVIPDHGTAGPDPRHWGEMVERHGVTVWNSVPALMQLMTEYEAARGSGALRGLKLVMLSGDWIGLELPGEVTRYAPAARVVSLGGATEASIWSILYEVEGVEAGWRSIPYGHPMNNQRVYVLNERMEECPEWVSGELYIGGVGVARGYWRDEARTGRSFVEWGGERVYRTGDVGRQLGCGEIEFLGREDAQVKVQGHRIELGEIEAALHGHEGVRGCAVKAVGERLGAKSLVAYIVTESAGAPDADELRGFLREKLPGYMVPSTFIFLDALPLNSNGKVNRGALPAPEHFALQDGRDLLLPRSPLEEMVANIWAELLGVPRVGLDDNFFELGGQSVTATRMLARVRNTFDVEMPLRALFDGPALGEFAAALEDALRSGQRLHAPPIRPVPRDGHLSLSFAQQRLWFLDRLQPESAVYNLSAALRLNGPLDVAALEESLREIIRRHESLRTTFKEVEGRPLQVISPPRFSLDAVDLRGLEAAEREARARQLAAEEAQRPFDLARGPLLRVRLLKLNEDEYVALFTMHHIIGDGWSIGVLMRELTALYEAFDKGRLSPLGELPIQYADFAVWQRGWLQGEVLDKQLAYWRQQLAGELAALALPTDRPHPPVRTYCGGLRSFTLSLEASEKLKGLSRREGVTLYMTLLAGLKTLLYRYSGQEDVIIGTPIANRSLKELENIIGLFVNTLVLRTDLSGDPTFTELLARVREVTLGAYAHQDVPFEKLVEELQPERNLSGSPFFNVMFAFQNAPEAALHFRDLKLSPFRAETETAKFDLNFNMVETPGGLRGLVTYQTDLFDDSTIERLLSHFVTLLEAAAATPGAKLSDLPMASDAEHRRLLVELNDTDRDFPGGRCLHELFEEQAARTPEAVALVFEGERLSYAELNRRANQLAHHLRALGARPETLVGLCVERSPDLIVGLLGILKAGGAYVPLDPASPKERLAVMLEVSRPPLLLTHGVLSERLPDGVTSVVLLDEDWPAIARASGQNPSPLATPENSAYVIFTSGSTGEPKGVVIEQRQILNYYHAIVERLSLSPGMGFAMVQPLTFDSSQTMLFPALCTGGTLHLIPRELAADPTALNGYFARHSIDALKISPSHLAALQDSDHPEHLLPRRCLVLGGEASRWDWVEGLQRLAPECVIFNHYGPTEATVGMLTFKHDAAATDCPPGNVPLGRPLANTRAYVLDSRLQPVATTVQGELYIGGAGVARGYLGDPAKTAERFIPDPFSAELGARLYKTGDTVRHLADGNLLFIGRTDSQVKVRGFRVELGEIEGVLRRHASVKEAVLVAREDERRGTVLFAYAVAHPEPEGEVQPRLAERLKEYLQERLPEYMVPAAVTLLDALPLSAHGKISLKALPTPELAEAEATGGFVAPRDEVESRLSQIWQEVLGLDSVSVTASFFDLGGHSLLATQAVSRINRAFRFELPLRRIFESPTIAGLARHVEQALREGRQSKLPPLCRVERDGNSLPLSFAQQRLWFLDQLEPESTAYNRPAAIRLVGRLDIAALEQALNEIIRRHETLRSTFAVVDGDIVQVLHPPRKLAVSVIDLEELDEGERESQLREMIAELSRERFDLSRWPLLKVKLARLGDEEHVVLLVMHHIITDYWSLEVFVRETAALYEAFRNDLPSPLEELVIQYADFAHWQRQWLQGEALQEQLSYWRKALAAAPPSLHLPTDRPRQGLRSWRGMVAPFHLPSPLSDRLRAMSREEDVTLFMLLLAAFQVLLYGYTGQENVVVGTTIANRKYREVEKLIGFFINTLALCTDLSGNPSFRELLARVREVTLGAYDHQDLPFEKILEEVQRERHAEERLTLGVFFQLLNAPQSSQELPGLTVERLDIESDTSKLELNFSLMESAEGGGIGGRLEYSTDLFDAMTIDRMMTGYRTLLEAVAENPDADLEALAGLVEGDALMLDDFNADIEAG
jgi:amino acid adenylation domain-containing protein